jgi:hypothetical protein
MRGVSSVLWFHYTESYLVVHVVYSKEKKKQNVNVRICIRSSLVFVPIDRICFKELSSDSNC